MAKQIKRSPASLFGGIIIAVVIFALWLLIFWEPNAVEIAIGAAIALVIAVWTRVANL